MSATLWSSDGVDEPQGIENNDVGISNASKALNIERNQINLHIQKGCGQLPACSLNARLAHGCFF